MINFILGVMIGIIATFVFLSLVAVARREDDKAERQYREYMEQKRKENNDD